MLIEHCEIGFRTRVFEERGAFKRAVLKGGFDFAVYDLTNPSKDGADLSCLREIKAAGGGRVVVAVREMDLSKARKLEGSFGILAYPFKSSDFIRELRLPMSNAARRDGKILKFCGAVRQAA